jgi:hypothetical protein
MEIDGRSTEFRLWCCRIQITLIFGMKASRFDTIVVEASGIVHRDGSQGAFLVHIVLILLPLANELIKVGIWLDIITGIQKDADSSHSVVAPIVASFSSTIHVSHCISA